MTEKETFGTMIKNVLEMLDYVVIDEMEGEPRYNGKSGFIDHIDDIGQLHGSWGSLAINPQVDKIRVYRGNKLIWEKRKWLK